MTTWAWILVDVFALMGQEEGQEGMLQYSSGIEMLLEDDVAPSTIISQSCAAFGDYNLNSCNIL